MKITVLQSGFVNGDFLTPIAYAGEMNARVIEITHPLFDNSFYQILILKENRPYVLGIQDGKFILPPSLTDIATTLKCQFMALRKNDSVDLSSENCSCYPVSSNDCSNMIFKSDKFNLVVAEGLNINGLTPIPPYEQLVDMYNNINKAKLSVEKSKLENEMLANVINDKIDQMQHSNYLNTLKKEQVLRESVDKNLNEKLDSVINSLNLINEKITEKSIYIINYYGDDETLINSQTKRHNEAISILKYVPTKEGSVFVNWKDKETGTEFVANDIYSDNKDLNLYPIWE